MLAVCIVHKHHRELESLCLVELDEAEDTCSCLLASTDHIRDKVYIFCVHEVHEVTAIVDDDIRSNLEDATDVVLILLWSRIVPCKHVKACLNESSRYVILSRKRVTSCYIHLRSTCCENLAKVSCLRFKMHGKSHLEALERKCRSELFLESIKERHVVPYPVNFESALRPELHISDFACHMFLLLFLIFGCKDREILTTKSGISPHEPCFSQI